ncbi:MAG: hypothetical protein J6Y98_04495 [Bacteroidales bacterium]|nr:hypothetical protein [Bacteroidales bacterium]
MTDMKRILILIVVSILVATSAEAQRIKRSTQKEYNNFNWYLLRQGDYQGAEIEKGVPIIPLEMQYSKITYFNDKYFFAEKGRNSCIYDKNGTPVLSDIYDFKHILGGYFYAKNGRENCIYNKECKPIIGNLPDDFEDCEYFRGLIIFKTNGYYTVYDTNAHLVIPTDRKYVKIIAYREYDREFLKVYTKFDWNSFSTNICGICNTNGDVVISPERGYNDIEIYSTKRFYSARTGELMYRDKKTKTESGYEGSELFYYSVRKDWKYGLCDINGNEYIAPEYDSRVEYVGNTFVYRENNYATTHYLGLKLSDDGQIISDEDKPFGGIEERNYQYYSQTTNSISTPTSTSTSPKASQSSSSKPKTQQNNPSSPSETTSIETTTKKNNNPKYKPSRSPIQLVPPNTGTKCGCCNGSGTSQCWQCKGNGKIRKSGINKDGKQVFYYDKCNICNAKGTIKCTCCRGVGTR